MNVYERALKTWGTVPQMLQVVEEMSELAKEILKNVNRGKDNLEAIIEETSDVEIMLEQLKYCYNIHKQVESYKADKLKLIEHRIDEWIKNHDNATA